MLLCLKTNLWPFWKACNFLTTLSTNPDYFFFAQRNTSWQTEVLMYLSKFSLLNEFRWNKAYITGMFSFASYSQIFTTFCLNFFFLALFFFSFFFVLYLDYILVWETICWFLARNAQLVPLVTFLLPFYCRYFLYGYLVVRPHLGAKRTDILWNYERRL